VSFASWLTQCRGEAPAVPAVRLPLRIARRRVLVRFDSHELADRLGRSLRHLRDADAGDLGGDLSIDCWTSDHGVSLAPPPDWPRDGNVHIEDGTISLVWAPPDGPLVVYDRSRRHAWMRFEGLEAISTWEIAAPFRTLLHWWAADQGLQLVHAAAVGHADGGLLLVGRGGSGKSTTALACLAGSLGYVGDDYCLVEGGERPWIHGLYLSGKGNARTAELLPDLRHAFQHAAYSIDGKSVVFADEIRPASVLAGCPLQAIVVPRIEGGSTSRVEPIAAVDALRALAPSTLLQLPGGRAGGLGRLAGLVRRVPAWRLGIGDDPASAVPVLADLLRTA